MLRSDGYLKVLGSGLAKLTERPAATDTEAQTRALVTTSRGAVMGTVNYVSPEQASGQSVDSRTDISSLGVLIYEMVTGRMPFQGPTPSHITRHCRNSNFGSPASACPMGESLKCH